MHVTLRHGRSVINKVGSSVW